MTKGDFSRIRFSPDRAYSAVLAQQGRVSVDADLNEQAAIEASRRERINTDVIGQFGGPEGDAGFAITISGNSILIGPGRYYVDGILVENPQAVSYDQQPYLIQPAYSAAALLGTVAQSFGRTTAQLALEVWQRLVTQLDDPCLAEPALGQADTSARLQTVWRVASAVLTDTEARQFVGSGKFIAPTGAEAKLSPRCQIFYSELTPAARTGSMGADTSSAAGDCGCAPTASAGFQGLENQLYRVEIHQGGDASTATFKWSRENASVVTSVTNVSGAVLTVGSLGSDANLGFASGQWVELSDDTDLFGQTPNQPGALYQIKLVTPATSQVTLTQPVGGLDTSRNARMRRWDQAGDDASLARGIPLSTTPVALENGIEVTFGSGQYIAGDAWTIPARTATGALEWPPSDSDGEFFQAAGFTRIHVAPIACIRYAPQAVDVTQNPGNGAVMIVERSGASAPSEAAGMSKAIPRVASPGLAINPASQQQASAGFIIDDCRLLFPPLTDITDAAAPAAMHVSSISWKNDDVMTVDAFLAQGLSVTFDTPPACPWSGANFQVTLEPPYVAEPAGNFAAGLKMMATVGGITPTDIFLRLSYALDPPQGITVAGNTVTWLPPFSGAMLGQSRAEVLTFYYLNSLLAAGANMGGGYGRMRVRLHGGAVYSSGNALYLDGQSFGSTSARGSDGSACVALADFSGAAQRASDFDGWFYLAPTVVINSVSIQAAIPSGATSPVTAVVVDTTYNNVISGYSGVNVQTQLGLINNLHAAITLSYPPTAPVTVTLTLTGAGVGTIVTMPGTATGAAGQVTINVPISIQANPGSDATGALITDTVTLNVSIQTAVGNVPGAQSPSLAIIGSIPPIYLR